MVKAPTYIEQFVKMLFLFFIVFMQYSCIRESFRECVVETDASLYIEVVATTGEKTTIPAEEIDMIDLFVFNREGYFLEHKAVPIEDIIEGLPVVISSMDNELLVSVWGNLKGNQLVPDLNGSCKIDNQNISLRLNEENFGECPDDLFFGYKAISLSATRATTEIREVIPISRKNGRMHITVRGLPNETDESAYYFTIHNNNNGYNFKGEPVNNPIHIKQNGVFDLSTYDFCTREAFNVIHSSATDQGMTINLHRNASTRSEETTIVSVNKDSNNNPIIASSGKTTNILIDLNQGTSVTVITQVSAWNELHHWVKW